MVVHQKRLITEELERIFGENPSTVSRDLSQESQTPSGVVKLKGPSNVALQARDLIYQVGMPFS